ncbi:MULTISPECIES: ethanolamine utilization protein EutH [unclassified Granulicatella]|uniref:ethanolamine utilization protein EutH n=1 Tax=unclassified Granulicatella TaxID=2630493 RepID=UPI00107496C5|nr:MULTISPECIES: ethanolamine utilization protein EutH [unclassified Granulicatella]MBF0780129.1 ethanolamine utilization protein EutH [Granulicatella sp. 19428wC4_WM01]TFU95795.1 ethanolamine utilization protein EutH [Granulicatella sp. WM01]
MSVDKIIIYIMAIFMIIAAVDKCIGGKLGLSEKFEEGIMAMGALALSMAGIMVVAPIIASVLRPIVVPMYESVGADPSIFATTFIANDMGGAPLALSLAKNEVIGKLAAYVLGAMMGPTIVFTIPVALGIIQKEDRPLLARGVLYGIVTIPIGFFLGGLFVPGINIVSLAINLVPIAIVAGLILLGLILIPNGMIKGFEIFGQGVVILATLGLAFGGFQLLTETEFLVNLYPVVDGVQSTPASVLKEAFEVVGHIAVTLAGAFALVAVFTKVANKPLLAIGKSLGMNEVGAAGLVASMANNIAMFQMLKDMDKRGKIINVAFAVSASFVIGDHLGFTAGAESSMIVPMIIAKLIGGVTAVLLAFMLTRKEA